MRGATILVVDDDELVLTCIGYVLREKDYTVLEAHSSADAFRLAQILLPIHILLTDVFMPDMTGPVLAKRFKHIHPDARVIYMSGYQDIVLAKCQLSDTDRLLRKPFEVDALLEEVEEALAVGGVFNE